METRKIALLRSSIVISLLLLALSLGMAASAFAGEVVGTVTHLSGPLFAKKVDGTTKVLSQKSSVEQGDTLVSEKRTYARVKFTDNSEVTLRPNSQLKIENYSYDQAKPKEDSAVFSLAKGGLRAITGAVGKRGDPDSYKMKAPSATIGIRGTTYECKICSGNCPGLANGLYFFVAEGAIKVSNPAGMQHLDAGQYAYVKDPGTKPVILPGNPGQNFALPPAVVPDSGTQKHSGSGDSNKVDCAVR